jgi:hypothetical protein
MTDLPVNHTATQADKMVKTIENILVPIAENAIITACPEMGLPVVKQITEIIEQALADKFTKLAETGVTFAVIDMQVEHEDSNVSDALNALALAYKNGDKDAIVQALKNYADATSAVDHDDGSASPL